MGPSRYHCPAPACTLDSNLTSAARSCVARPLQLAPVSEQRGPRGVRRDGGPHRRLGHGARHVAGQEHRERAARGHRADGGVVRQEPNLRVWGRGLVIRLGFEERAWVARFLTLTLPLTLALT